MFSQIKHEISTTPYFQQHFSNDGQRYVAWYLMNIHNRDMIQTKEDVTDGKDDKQIDAIFVDDERSAICIVQGKFVSCDKIDAEPLREVLSSWVQLKDLVKLQETSNSKLKTKLPEVAIALEDEYDIEFELITPAGLTEAAIQDLATFQKVLAESDEFGAHIHVINNNEMKDRYQMALGKDKPGLKHLLNLEENKFLNLELSGTQVLLAALPLKDCLSLPGIRDGSLFKKNVRQSLGLNNKVNRGIKETILKEADEFFFYHNGITAICNRMSISEQNQLELEGLSVVNGCQSLNTILSCSEHIKKHEDAYIMFRFYEIPEIKRADKISISTNSQSSVKPRDLRSNDKRVLAFKKQYEQRYSSGYIITKRGEEAPSTKNKDYVIDLSTLGKYLMAWHSQRPNMAYSETRIFDKYFDQLFKRNETYKPEKAFALNQWMLHVKERWEKSNPLGLNESLLAMKAYAPYHHLYAISLCFCVANSIPEGAPDPEITFERAQKSGIVDQVVDMAGSCLNSALEAAANQPQPANRVFSPQNWIKTKTCLAGIRLAIGGYLSMLPSMPGGKELNQQLRTAMKMDPSEFEARWAAD